MVAYHIKCGFISNTTFKSPPLVQPKFCILKMKMSFTSHSWGLFPGLSSPHLRFLNSQETVFCANILWTGEGDVRTLGLQLSGWVFVDGTWRQSGILSAVFTFPHNDYYPMPGHLFLEMGVFSKTNSFSQGLSKVRMLALKDLLLAKSMRYSSNWIKSSHALWYNSRTSLNPSCYLFFSRPRTPEMEALPSRLCWLFLPRLRTQKRRLFLAGSVGYWTCFPYFYPGIERRHCFWLTSIYRLISRIFDSKVSPGIVCVREPLKFW